jgi:leader peptidase (prepilin peptidase) / N-methyltransferase
LSDLQVIEIFFAFLFGAVFGSFANVAIYRMPQSEGLWGRSHCMKCKKMIPWYENIPLFSYFILKGRCSSCSEKFSIRYVSIEFLTAVLFSLVVYFYGVTWLTLEYLILVLGLVIGSFIDIDHMILPDEITLGGIVVGLIGAWLNPDRLFLDALLGVLFGGGILWLVAYIYFVFTGREGLGGGDIKLLGWLGCLLEWRSIPFIVLTASIFGSIVGLVLSRRKSEGLKTMIPFGPFLAFGALLYMFGLKSVGYWYVDLFFPALTQ